MDWNVALRISRPSGRANLTDLGRSRPSLTCTYYQPWQRKRAMKRFSRSLYEEGFCHRTISLLMVERTIGRTYRGWQTYLAQQSGPPVTPFEFFAFRGDRQISPRSRQRPAFLSMKNAALRKVGFEELVAVFELPLFGGLFAGAEEGEAFGCGVFCADRLCRAGGVH